MDSTDDIETTLTTGLDRFREDGDLARFQLFLSECRAPEIADALQGLVPVDQATLFQSATPELQADLLEETEGRTQDTLLALIEDPARRSAVLEEMGADDVADLVDEMTEEQREEILVGVDSERAETIRDLARYDPDSAGGLMTPEFLAVEEHVSVQDVKDRIRGDED